MKKSMMRLVFILLILSHVPSVNADLAGSSALSVSLANYDPDPAIAGDTVEMRIGIENRGGAAINNIVMEVIPEYPFELIPGESAVQNTGMIQGYDVNSNQNLKIIKYRMIVNKDAPAGKYEFKIKYYDQNAGDVIQKSLFIDVKSRQSAEVIHIDKTMLVPGKQSSLKFTINNVGNAPLRDLTFYWENDEKIILPVGSDNTRYIRYIDISNGTDLEYQVMADTNAQPGLYKLNLYLTYEDTFSNKTAKINTFAGVYVGGGTDFDVAFSDNANGQISFSIANIGSNPANSVSVIIPEQPVWRVIGPNSVIIGNLNKGDYTVASFNLQSSTGNSALQNRTGRSNSTTQGRYLRGSMNNSFDKITVQIAYTDTMGERTVVNKQVMIGNQNEDLSSSNGQPSYQGRRNSVQNSTSSSYIWYLSGIVLLIGGLLVHRKYTNLKLLNPDLKLMDLLKNIRK